MNETKRCWQCGATSTIDTTSDHISFCPACGDAYKI
jgi:membrane protease subunit (stomatin/prohibitin family)